MDFIWDQQQQQQQQHSIVFEFLNERFFHDFLVSDNFGECSYIFLTKDNADIMTANLDQTMEFR